MRAWIWIALVGCDSGTPPPKSPGPLSARAEPSAVVADAAVVVVVTDAPEPPGDAISEAHRLDVRQAVRDAPPWIGRVYSTGMLPGKHTLTTYFLRRDGDQALVTVEEREEQRDGSWKITARREWPYVSEERAGTLTLRPLNGEADAPLSACKGAKVKMATATAIRVRSPGYSECGDTGRWSPANTKSVAILKCTDDATDWNQIAFAPAPGIEWLFVNNDCVIQGGGWRAVPPDGSIKQAYQN